MPFSSVGAPLRTSRLRMLDRRPERRPAPPVGALRIRALIDEQLGDRRVDRW